MKRHQSLMEALNLTERHESQISGDFMVGMAARMATSFEKYGDVKDAYPRKLDAIGSGLLRLQRYLGPEKFREVCETAMNAAKALDLSPHRREHGNTEYLIDAANFFMIEFMLPRHEGAHFKAEDSAASPGRVGVNGQSVGAMSNTQSHDNVRRGGSKMKTAGGFYKNEGD